MYQNLFAGSLVYNLIIKKVENFQPHFHYEMEILYCLDGSFTIGIDNQFHEVKKGEAIVVGSMLKHSINSDCDNKTLLIEFGPSLLREHFGLFANVPFYKIYSGNNEIFKYLDSIVGDAKASDTYSELMIIGGLYKLYAFLSEDNHDTVRREDKSDTYSIAKSLTLIYRDYNKDLTIDDVAKYCKCGKSTFCRLFKNAMGTSFHHFLNEYRIKIAENLLIETNGKIENITDEVGFKDAKSFCRVFKKHTGISPSQYRKYYGKNDE